MYTLLAIRTVGNLMWQQRPEKIRVKIHLLIRLGHLNSQLFSISLQEIDSKDQQISDL